MPLAGCAAPPPLQAAALTPPTQLCFRLTAGPSAQARPAPCASITAGAVLPAAAAVAATPAQLPPLAGLAHDVQQAIVMAAAAARGTVLVSRGTAAPLRRRRRVKPANKPASSSVESSAPTKAALAPTATPAAAVAPPRTAAAPAAAAAASTQKQRSLRQFVAGGLAGAVSKTLVAPMERVSTLLMTDAQRRFSLGAAARHAWRDGLYRGHAATLVKVGLECRCRLGTGRCMCAAGCMPRLY